MLTAHHISKYFHHNQILKDISFSINVGERVGLIGPNGCGKTTLLRILTGEDVADSGHVSLSPTNLRLGYLPQGFITEPNIKIKSLIQKTIDAPDILEVELATIATELATNPDQPELQTAYDAVLNRLQQPSRFGQLSTILSVLELDKIPDDQIVMTLSGGQKTRLSLALVLLSEPQLLLLDEPTNHLDISMLEWLEDWLTAFKGGVLIVSHDRTFLEQSVTRIIELSPETHSIRAYDGSYSDYIEQVTQEHDKQWAAYRDQVEDIRRMKRDIQRTRSQAERTEREASSIRIGGGRMKIKGYKDYQQGIAKKVARKAISREKKLDRYLDSDERVEKPKTGWQIKLEFNNSKRPGKDVLNLEKLSVGYPTHDPLLKDISLIIQSGQRVAFTGRNGSGKTTLLRTISGTLSPKQGALRLGSSVKLGYMSQEQETLDLKSNAVEIIRSVSHFNHTETRNFLHYYLFRGDDPLRPVESYSYGERSRLMLAKLVAQGCNFLILDEPINHLDIPSRERFEQAINGFDGTILAVVHDRFFINRFATELWVIDNYKIRREVLS